MPRANIKWGEQIVRSQSARIQTSFEYTQKKQKKQSSPVLERCAPPIETLLHVVFVHLSSTLLMRTEFVSTLSRTNINKGTTHSAKRNVAIQF